MVLLTVCTQTTPNSNRGAAGSIHWLPGQFRTDCRESALPLIADIGADIGFVR